MKRSVQKLKLPKTTSPWASALVRELEAWSRDVCNNINDQQIGTAIASAATISPDHPIHHVTGTAAISTINVPTGHSGPLHLIPDGIFTLATGGNIAKASTAVVGQTMILTYDQSSALWYPSY